MLTSVILNCAGRELVLDRPRVCGIVNVTPDSFSDSGACFDVGAAVAHGLKLEHEGADLIDVGGESTRPGAAAVSEEEEIARVVPMIKALSSQAAVPISIDTSKPNVMRAAVAAGAGMINDVYALRKPGALDAAAELGVPVCLMHMQGTPTDMQQNPQYSDVVGEVQRFLAERAFACQLAGIDKKRLIVDPGFGFGKTLDHNLALLRGLEKFTTLDIPILVGLSRKSFIGALTGRETSQRVYGSVAAALLAVQRGAMILRVHDVAATRDALAVWAAEKEGALALRSIKPDNAFRQDDDD